MPRGLNTEIDPRNLPQGSFSEFTQVTLRGGVVHPRNADESHTPSGGSIEEWRLGKVGTYDFVTVYDSDSEDNYEIYTAKAAGTPQIYDHGTTTEHDLVIGASTSAPTLSSLKIPYDDTLPRVTGGYGPFDDVFDDGSGGGIAPAATGKYTFTWRDTLTDTDFGLSDVYNLENIYVSFKVTLTGGSWPAVGDVITNTTKNPDETATIWGIVPLLTTKVFIVKALEDSMKTSAWASADVITWSSGTGTGTVDENETGRYVIPTFSKTGDVPTDATEWGLYRLEDATGYWRLVDHDVVANTLTEALVYSGSDFPYDASGVLFPLWPGPLDSQYLPETLVGSMTAAQTLCVHKGCLFVAEGSKIRFSEPEQPRYFREWAILDAFDTVIGMVSRDEVMEVYTARAVKYIIGNAPYFEIRETGITEGPVSRNSICATDVGTFALFEDGAYIVTGGTRRNLTAGVLGPTIEGMTRSTAVGGAAKGIYYLCDGTTAYAFDWERDEWFKRTFSAAPLGFYYSDTSAALIAKLTGPTYSKVGTDSSSTVSFAVTWPEVGDGRYRAAPKECFLDIDGTIAFAFKTDGTTRIVYSVTGTERLPLAIERCRYYTARLTGTGKASTTEIRALEWRL